MTLANRILSFNDNLSLSDVKLPEGVKYMNPFKGDNTQVIRQLTSTFYKKYYSDNNPRHIIFGINPGRLGAGLTGIPFTDTLCLEQDCEISALGIDTRETSAVFIYEMIRAFGGADLFYKYFFIGAVSPLGYVKLNSRGSFVNYNYYDDKELSAAVEPSIERWFRQQVDLGMQKDVAFCLGTGKNFKYLAQLNKKLPLFDEIVALEHPRFIMQYRNKRKQEYIDKFIKTLSVVVN